MKVALTIDNEAANALLGTSVRFAFESNLELRAVAAKVVSLYEGLLIGAGTKEVS